MVETILKSLFSVVTKMVIKACSAPVIEWALFYIAEQIVKTTKTVHDDLFLERLKAEYKRPIADPHVVTSVVELSRD